MTLLLNMALAIASFCLIALLLVPVVVRPSRADRHVLRVVRRHAEDQQEVSARQSLLHRLRILAKKICVIVGISGDEKLKQRLLGAGLRQGGTMDVYLASRLICPLLSVILGSFIPGNRMLWIFLSAILGYLLPDLWLGTRVKKRRERIRRSIPDAMDLLVICVDAGLGLDQALMRVGQELAISHPDINQEFMQINLEQRAGKPRLEAWQSMADRTKLPEFSAFVSMLTQTDRFGTPIVRALSRYADEMRLKRRQHAEEQAAKTKVKILFPLIIFIFPCLFIVLLAPAVISITKGLGALGK